MTRMGKDAAEEGWFCTQVDSSATGVVLKDYQ